MIGHNPKFIFIHIPKTGGNTISNVLLDYADMKWIRKNTHAGKQQGLKCLTISKHSFIDEWVKYCKGDVEDYYIFTVLRNPYDKMVSFLNFSADNDINHIENQKFTLYPFRKYFGNMIDKVDYFIDFNYFHNEFDVVLDDLGIKEEVRKRYPATPHINKYPHKHWKEYFNNDELINRFREQYQDDIDLYNKYRKDKNPIDERYGL